MRPCVRKSVRGDGAVAEIAEPSERTQAFDAYKRRYVSKKGAR